MGLGVWLTTSFLHNIIVQPILQVIRTVSIIMVATIVPAQRVHGSSGAGTLEISFPTNPSLPLSLIHPGPSPHSGPSIPGLSYRLPGPSVHPVPWSVTLPPWPFNLPNLNRQTSGNGYFVCWRHGIHLPAQRVHGSSGTGTLEISFSTNPSLPLSLTLTPIRSVL